MPQIQNFIDFMTRHDCAPANAGDIKASDKWTDYQIGGDKNGKKKGFYTLKIDGEYVSGACGDRRTGEVYQYRGKPSRALTDEERRAFAKRRAAEKKAAEAEEKQRHETASQKAVERWKEAKAGPHAYLERKAISGEGSRVSGDKLLIPMYADDRMWGIQTIDTDGGKMFQAGGRKKGCFCPLTTSKEPKDVIAIAEGFATAASVRAATGWPLLVAFDAGNLKPVAEAMRRKYPEARIVICGDYDTSGTGQAKAEEAAQAVGGLFVLPDVLDKDFNDLAQERGLDWLKGYLEDFLNSIVPEPEECGCPESYPDYHDDLPIQEPETETRSFGKKDMFRVLGHNNGQYYYFSFPSRQIVSMSASGHTIKNMLQLAPISWWRMGWDKDTTLSTIETYSADNMIERAHRTGVFFEENRVRGAGGWVDDCGLVIHCGDSLVCAGQKIDLMEIESKNTYIAAPKCYKLSSETISNSEANELRLICESVTWENKLSGSLLAGWLVVAPLCAALPYRPHIYLTGEAESGKSTVLDKIIKPSLGRVALSVDGGTTEPAIRDMMGHDSRPIVFDEAELSTSMLSVIELARKSSTGSTVKKYGQRPFNARSCFCFSAINPPINKMADETRISFMVIKRNRKPNAIEDYETLLERIEKLITPDFAERLLTRTVLNWATLFKNIATFQKAARIILGSPRAASQIGVMIAGLYSLGRSNVISLDDAKAWMKKHDWSEHTAIKQDADPVRLIQHISSYLISWSFGGQRRDISLGELIQLALVDKIIEAEKTLRNYGIIAKIDGVTFANRNQNLSKALRGTDWEIKWSRTLLDIQGATKRQGVYFSFGVKSDAVMLPASLFVDVDLYEQPTNEEDIEF